MSLSQTEMKRHQEFIEAKVKTLGVFDFPHESTMLWHYTNGPGLIGIVESGVFFSTQVSCLSDSTEIRYASSLFKNALTMLLPKYADNPEAEAFVTKYIKLIDDEPERPSHAPSPYFVTCFSRLEDDLSQWRSYSGGESGYALGFALGSLFGAANSVLVKVNYDKSLHENLAGEIAESTVTFFLEGLGERQGEDAKKWSDEFLAYWDPFITRLAPMVKDPGFSAEQEYRVIHEFHRDELKDIVILQKKTMMSRHLRLEFPLGGEAWVPRLPISRVIVGPCRHREISRISVDTLLRKMGYGTGKVFSSVRPFQET